MNFARWQRPLVAAAAASGLRPAPTRLALVALPLRPAPTTTTTTTTAAAVAAATILGPMGIDISGRRHASVKAQGAYKLRPKRTIPKKLGAKRATGEYVIPGNILWKQRGTIWWPGENCMMGRDHTIHATAPGFVQFYRDPERHPDRKYIGVTFNRDDKLPYPKNQPRKRRLGMVALPVLERSEKPELSPSGIPYEVQQVAGLRKNPRKQRPDPHVLRLRDDYSYREDNWRIGLLQRCPSDQHRRRPRRPRQQQQ
jgi:large subunit ribosomal protein L27